MAQSVQTNSGSALESEVGELSEGCEADFPEIWDLVFVILEDDLHPGPLDSASDRSYTMKSESLSHITMFYKHESVPIQLEKKKCIHHLSILLV